MAVERNRVVGRGHIIPDVGSEVPGVGELHEADAAEQAVSGDGSVARALNLALRRMTVTWSAERHNCVGG